MPIVLDQPETDAVQPPNATAHILPASAKKYTIENIAIPSIESSTSCPHAFKLLFAAGQIQPQGRRKLSAEQAKRGTAVDVAASQTLLFHSRRLCGRAHIGESSPECDQARAWASHPFEEDP